VDVLQTQVNPSHLGVTGLGSLGLLYSKDCETLFVVVVAAVTGGQAVVSRLSRHVRFHYQATATQPTDYALLSNISTFRRRVHGK